jgi:hypothetical protein
MSIKKRCTFLSAEAGSVTSEYVVVMAGLLIVFLGIGLVLELIDQHSTNYSATLRLLF